MAIAMLLRWHDYVWGQRLAGRPGMWGTPPAWTLSTAINMPAAIVASLWKYMELRLWGDAMYVAVVGVLWYWLALNLESWQKRRVVCTFAKKPLRVTTDLLLIMLGLFFGAAVVYIDLPLPLLRYGFGTFWNEVRMQSIQGGWLWFVTVAVLHTAWAVALLFFFGRDLISIVRDSFSRSTSA